MIWAHALVSSGVAISLFFVVGFMRQTPQNTPPVPEQTVLTLPFEHGKFDVMLVKAEVNGRPAVLLLDTGARMSVVSPEIMGIEGADLFARFSPGEVGFRGEAMAGRTRVRLGNQTWQNHLVAIMNLSEVRKMYDQHIDGLLGEDLLCKFKRVTFDYPSRRITLSK